MLLATWNVNSLRARAEQVFAWLDRVQPDVVALQETKCRDDQVPVAGFLERGYEVAHHGLSQWNGVAVVSRVGLVDVCRGFPGMPTWGSPPVEEARALGATCGGVRVWSLYVPNGRAPGDPHFSYKMEWLTALHAAAVAQRQAHEHVALCGDFNVAPTDADVWDPARFVGSTHVTPAERAAFAALQEAGYADVVRPSTPGPDGFTYWDYYRDRFARNHGMRIDFVLCSPPLAARVSAARVDREERARPASSDHAPVLVQLA